MAWSTPSTSTARAPCTRPRSSRPPDSPPATTAHRRMDRHQERRCLQAGLRHRRDRPGRSPTPSRVVRPPKTASRPLTAASYSPAHGRRPSNVASIRRLVGYTYRAESTRLRRVHRHCVRPDSSTGASYGIAKVTLDGTDIRLVDFYSASTLHQPRFGAATVADGDHTLTIEWTGNKNPARPRRTSASTPSTSTAHYWRPPRNTSC